MTNPEFSDDPRGGVYIYDGEKIIRVEDEHTTPEEKEVSEAPTDREWTFTPGKPAPSFEELSNG